jgi:hypothetical protein
MSLDYFDRASTIGCAIAFSAFRYRVTRGDQELAQTGADIIDSPYFEPRQINTLEIGISAHRRRDNPDTRNRCKKT